MNRISPATRAQQQDEGDNSNAVFNRLYGRSKPGAASGARSLSKDREPANKFAGGPPRMNNMGRQFTS